MSRRSSLLFKAALSALHYSRADGLMAPFTAGRGVVFMLHHVTPEATDGFSPNRILKVTPDFLDSVIAQVKAAGFDIIGLDDVPRRLGAGAHARPFAVFTLDDGYRDNRDHAYPIFKRHNVPFTIYVATDFADGKGNLWWLVLERALRLLRDVALDMNGQSRHFALLTDADKEHAFHEIYWWLRSIPEPVAREVTDGLAALAGFDPLDIGRQLLMTWSELRSFAEDPLVTLGAHTCTHHALAQLRDDDARREMSDSVRRLEAEIGKPCRHFSYPYGCERSAGAREFAIAAELGLATAVTTRKGLLHGAHADSLTALPRLSLNGEFQDTRYVKVLLSGVPFAFWNAVQKFSPQRAAAFDAR